MPWKDPGGNGGSGGPWGGGGGQGPWGRGSGGGPIPPDIDDLLRRGQERLRRFWPSGPGSGGRGIVIAVIAVILLWAATGVYTVAQDEEGVVLRFGRYVYRTGPGLHYHLPGPIETVLKPPVTRINRIELGFRSPSEGMRVTGRETEDESLMLTGDENIVDINFSVFWQIKDPEQFLFDIRDPEGTVKVVAESAMREVIGQLPIRAPLSENRAPIVERTRARMQELLDKYKAGISVIQVQLLKADPPAEVIDAFNDVQRAKADQERSSNEAEAYRNGIIPVARGDAERIVQEAEAYKEQTVDLAQGEAQRFESVLQVYKTAPEVTARRLYIDAMEDVLKGAQKVVIDPSARSVVPYLPLPALAAKPAPLPASAPAAGAAPGASAGGTK